MGLSLGTRVGGCVRQCVGAESVYVYGVSAQALYVRSLGLALGISAVCVCVCVCVSVFACGVCGVFVHGFFFFVWVYM